MMTDIKSYLKDNKKAIIVSYVITTVIVIGLMFLAYSYGSGKDMNKDLYGRVFLYTPPLLMYTLTSVVSIFVLTITSNKNKDRTLNTRIILLLSLIVTFIVLNNLLQIIWKVALRIFFVPELLRSLVNLPAHLMVMIHFGLLALVFVSLIKKYGGLKAFLIGVGLFVLDQVIVQILAMFGFEGLARLFTWYLPQGELWSLVIIIPFVLFTLLFMKVLQVLEEKEVIEDVNID